MVLVHSWQLHTLFFTYNAMQLHSLAVLLCLLLASGSLAAFQNVTTLLYNHPDYSSFNALLSRYGVASQINSRTAITVLCPPNPAIDAFLSGPGAHLDRLSMFNVLAYHVLLDYEDPERLRSIAGGSATITTLFQTTGLATGQDGFVNITVSRGVAEIQRPGSTTFAAIGVALEQFPFNISLLAVGEVLVPAGLGRGPAPSPVNITQIIAQAGNFSSFVSLLVSTGVDKVLQAHDAPPGITIFAPTNAAFDRLPPGAVSRLTSAQLVALMEFHALSSFYPAAELASASGPQPTLASGSGGGAYTITLSQDTAGVITINAGGNTVPIAGTVYDNNPVTVFVVGSVLQPAEIFGAAVLAPSPSPAAAPSAVPESSPVSTSPVPAASSTRTPSLAPSPPPKVAPSPAPSAVSPTASAPVSAPSASPPAPLASGPAFLSTPASGPGASSPESPASAADTIILSCHTFTFVLTVAIALFLP